MVAAAERIDTTARRRLILIAAILGSSVVFIDMTVVNVALPAMQRDLGGGLTLQQWVVDAYLLTLGSLILLGGSLGDLFGERVVFSAGVAAFGLTSVFCGLAPDGNSLIAARALQGVAGALLTPAALATITANFDGEERGAAIGTWTAWTGIGTVVGPLVGGWLVGHTSWRSIFFLNVPFCAATLLAISASLPRTRPQGRARIDLVGAALCVSGLGGSVFALIEEPRRGWGDPVILGTLVGGIFLFAFFLGWERRTDQPMLPLRLFRRRNFTIANVETLFVWGALSTITFFLALFLQQIVGYSPLQAGLALLPITVVMFALSRYVGRFSARIGPRLFMGIGPVLCAVGLLMLMRLNRDLSYTTDLLPGVIVFALGLALTVAPVTSTVLADAGAGDAGIASAVNNAVARVAGLLGIAVVGVAVAGRDTHLTVHGFHLAVAVNAVLLALGGVIGLVGIRRMVRSSSDPGPRIA
jgi:EmrB/QacA subfamily drug resistance transporter